MRALSDLLEYAIELDTGRYSDGTAPVILYVCRLIVRVEAFMLFIINHNRFDVNKVEVNGTGWKSNVRGLDLNPKQLKTLMDKRRALREVINEQVFPMLDRWCEVATKTDEIEKACILHAHLAFLFFHIPSGELTRPIVATLLSSQIFLTTRYRYDLAAENGASYNRMDKERAMESGLGIPDTEMFDVFQTQRPKILSWLNKDSIECNEVMEAVVRVVTMTGNRMKAVAESEGAKNHAGPDVQLRYWRSMDGMNCIGRFIPDMKVRTVEDQLRIERERAFKRGEQLVETEINIQLGSLTLNTSRLEVLDSKVIVMSDFKDVFGETGQQMQCAPVKITVHRSWVRLVGTRHDVQYWKQDDRTPRLFPFTRPYHPDTLSKGEYWIAKIIQKILPTHKLLRLVDQLYLPAESYHEDSAYAHLAGYQVDAPKRPDGKSSDVKVPQWAEASTCWKCQTPFTFNNRQHHCRYCGRSFCAACTPKVARIPEFGHNEAVRVCDECFVKLHEWRSIKEVVVFRKAGVVAIFNVVEHGRRWYRTLVWCSDSRWSLTDLPSIYPEDRSWMEMDRYACGNKGVHAEPSHPHTSLIITRNFTTLAEKTQMYVPQRFLKGLLPDALLDDFVFWQETDDSLTGYMRKELLAKRMTAHVLRVYLHRDDKDGATARVVRIPKSKYDEENERSIRELELKAARARGETVLPKAESESGRVGSSSDANGMSAEQSAKKKRIDDASAILYQLQEESEEEGVLTLLSPLYAAEGSTLQSVADFFVRLEDVSYILLWTKTAVTHAGESCSVDIIELPRLQMSFYSKTDMDGKVRLYSRDHFGFFVSNNREAMIGKILDGIPHSIVLENLDGDVSILVPATLPRRLKHQAESYSTEIMLIRRDKSWLNNMKVRQYLYPVHLSMTFLFTPTLSSALYLLLIRFLNRQYSDVFLLADSCVSDTRLSKEEEQILAQLKFINDDISPDSHACRLKLHLVMSDSSMPSLPWDVKTEMNEYLKKRQSISSVCRLSPLEEHTLLCLCQEGENPAVFNRFHFLGAVLNQQPQAPVMLPPALQAQDGGATGLLWPMKATWDAVVDQSCAKIEASFLAQLSRPSYTKPKDVKGLEAIKQLNKWIDNGIRLKGGKDDLGFLFFYELMTKTCQIRILDDDNPFELARVLCRLLPDPDMTGQSIMLSILRVLCRNPHLTADPNIPKTSGKNSGFFTSGKDNPYSQLLSKWSTWFAGKQKENAAIDWAASDAQKTVELPMTVPVPNAQSLPRDLICPRLTNVNCTRMEVGVKPEAKDSGKRVPGLSSEDILAFSDQPMSVLKLTDYVTQTTLKERGIDAVDDEMPFDVRRHPIARSNMSQSTLDRLRDDVRDYATQQNGGVEAELRLFLEKDAHAYVNQPNSAGLSSAVDQVRKLLNALVELQQKDTVYTGQLINHILRTVNGVVSSTPPPNGEMTKDDDASRAKYAFSLARYSGQETTIWFEFLVGVLASDVSEKQIRELSPLLSPATIRRAMDLVVDVLFHANRMGQTRRCIVMTREFLTMLTRFQSIAAANPALDLSDDTSLERTICIKAEKLAQQLMMKRYFVHTDDGRTKITFDPRFLVFEFTYNLMLRRSQIELVGTIMKSVQNDSGESKVVAATCHQMIMGAGKTTVVGPLLALLLADGKRLVTQVVPHSLLEFSRGITRERFSAVIRKPVYTFSFDRFMTVTQQLYRKLVKAMDSRAVIIATSTALKAFQLKFIELLHQLDQSHAEVRQYSGKDSREKKLWLEARKKLNNSLREQVQICVNVLKLLRIGTLIIDEVDLILHPLKSELNFPIGRKEPLDLTLNKSQKGLRWEIPLFLLDAVFFGTEGRMTVPLHNSREAEMTLNKIRDVLDKGYQQRDLQRTPHLVLLSRAFYHIHLKPLLARWIVIWMSFRQASGLTDDQMYSYLMLVKDSGGIKDKAVAVGIREDLLADEVMKLLNLAHDWLHSFLPFCLGKIDRVSFGLLNDSELTKALLTDPKMPKSRRVTAIPFIGKDVPSQRSEFSHPDVVIGLTILAYRYEGLRPSDFKTLMKTMQQNMWEEVGPYHKRQSSRLFADWVRLAGGKVRGSRMETENVKAKKAAAKRDELAKQVEAADAIAADPFFFDAEVDTDMATISEEDSSLLNVQRSHANATDIWPLRLIDFEDDEQYNIVFNLLFRLPELIYYYLRNFIFPPVMRHQGMKLASSGQDVGGEMLVNHRIGFSGTPSDLLPLELGRCQYEKGSDGQMLHYLTSPTVMSVSFVQLGWNPQTLLEAIAVANPPFSALIDTGALITGMSNLSVANFLLEKGLPEKEGVVYLDELDRKMILVRATMNSIPVSQCGIPDTKRFAFYDQVHTTGMDIQHSVNACAVITLGKDMTFRDYAQGAFRMRGIGRGQTLRLFVTPEIIKLMSTHVSAAGFKRDYPSVLATATPDLSSPAILTTPLIDNVIQVLDRRRCLAGHQRNVERNHSVQYARGTEYQQRLA